VQPLLALLFMPTTTNKAWDWMPNLLELVMRTVYVLEACYHMSFAEVKRSCNLFFAGGACAVHGAS